MKKLHLTFGIIAAVMTLVAVVIAFVLFVGTVNDPYTSFPAWAAFAVVGMYYAIGLAVLGIAWLSVWLILRHRTCENREKVL